MPDTHEELLAALDLLTEATENLRTVLKKPRRAELVIDVRVGEVEYFHGRVEVPVELSARKPADSDLPSYAERVRAYRAAQRQWSVEHPPAVVADVPASSAWFRERDAWWREYGRGVVGIVEDLRSSGLRWALRRRRLVPVGEGLIAGWTSEPDLVLREVQEKCDQAFIVWQSSRSR